MSVDIDVFIKTGHEATDAFINDSFWPSLNTAMLHPVHKSLCLLKLLCLWRDAPFLGDSIIPHVAVLRPKNTLMNNQRCPHVAYLIFVALASLTASACGSSSQDVEVAECNNGDTRSVPCGVKDQGTLHQICVDYLWVNDGRCDDPTECFDGEIRAIENACGWNDRGSLSERCSRGQWTPYDTGLAASCDVSLTPDCACDDPDECTDEDTQTTQCGLGDSGEQHWQCLGGQWVADGMCEGAWPCEEETEGVMPCGLNGRGEQPAICVDHQWVPLGALGRSAELPVPQMDQEGSETSACVDPDVCVDGEQGGTVGCGLENSGSQDALCKEGQWSPKPGAVCKNAWECLEGDTRTENDACGKNMRGTLLFSCAEDHIWTHEDCLDEDVCVDASKDERDCEEYGANNLPMVQHKSCVQGQWGPWGACTDSDRCLSNDGGDFTCGTADNRTGIEYRICDDGYWNTSVCWQRADAIYPAPRGLLISNASHGVLAMGDNTSGTIGDSDLVQQHYNYPVPTRVPDPQTHPEKYSASRTHQCAINANQDVRCWGQNDHGQLGPNALTSSERDPVHVPLPHSARRVAVGQGFSCALLADQDIYCWGQNDQFQLGRSTSQASDPIPARAFEGARLLTAGESHVCAVREGEVYCWGANDVHQASEQELAVIETPTLHPSLSHNPGLDLRPPDDTDMCKPSKEDDTLLSIVAGNKHTVVAWRTAWKESKFGIVLVIPFCTDGNVLRYTHLVGVGSNAHGQLATTSAPSIAEARVLKRIDDRLDQFVPHAAGDTTCLVREKGTSWSLECAGDNQSGQFDDAPGDAESFTAVAADLSDGENISYVALSHHSLCVSLGETGRIRCRGANDYGQLGDGTTDSRTHADFVLHVQESAP